MGVLRKATHTAATSVPDVWGNCECLVANTPSLRFNVEAMRASRFTRRGLLKVGLLGSAALALGGGTYLALRKGSGQPQAPRPLSAIAPHLFPVLVAVASRFIPPREPTAVEVALNVDRRLSYLSPSVQRDFNRALGLLENALAGLFLHGKAKPFTRLSAVEQDAALVALRDSRFALPHAVYGALRSVCTAMYYVNPAVAKRYGYDAPAVEKPDLGPIQARLALGSGVQREP